MLGVALALCAATALTPRAAYADPPVSDGIHKHVPLKYGHHADAVDGQKWYRYSYDAQDPDAIDWFNKDSVSDTPEDGAGTSRSAALWHYTRYAREFISLNKSASQLNGGNSYTVKMHIASDETHLKFVTSDSSVGSSSLGSGTTLVPRPRLVDADGNVTWPEFELTDDQTLEITVPDGKAYTLWVMYELVDYDRDGTSAETFYKVDATAEIEELAGTTAEMVRDRDYKSSSSSAAADGTATLSIQALVNGATPDDDQEFELELTADGATPLPYDNVAYVEGSEPASFGDIAYGTEDAGNTYTYTIRVSEDQDGDWVSTGDVTVTVKVGVHNADSPWELELCTVTYSTANDDGTAGVINLVQQSSGGSSDGTDPDAPSTDDHYHSPLKYGHKKTAVDGNRWYRYNYTAQNSDAVDWYNKDNVYDTPTDGGKATENGLFWRYNQYARDFISLNKNAAQLNDGNSYTVRLHIASDETGLQFETGDESVGKEELAYGSNLIPRPRLVDEDGNVTWPEFKLVDNQTLEVTVPDGKAYTLWFMYQLLNYDWDGDSATGYEVFYKVDTTAEIEEVSGTTAKMVRDRDYSVNANSPYAEGSTTINIQKLVNGKAPIDDQEYEFELTADGDTPMPDEGGCTVTTKGAEAASFGKITYGFEDAGNTYTYTYTIHEKTKLGDGWVNSGDVTVKVKVGQHNEEKFWELEPCTVTYSNANADGTAGVINNMHPGKLYVSKTVDGAEAGAELAGCELQIEDADGNVLESWTSTGEKREVAAELTKGTTYKLVETRAADGYTVADPVEFTYDVSQGDQSVEMKDSPTHVELSKYDSDGNPLSGAKLQVLDASGSVVDEWVSDGAAHVLDGKLVAGATYTLHETEAPENYQVADDVSFTVPTTAETLQVSMKDAKAETPSTPETPPTPETPKSETPEKSLPKTGDDASTVCAGSVVAAATLMIAGLYLRKKLAHA